MRTQCSHSDCNACAREFFRWLKGRMAQMAMPTRGGGESFAAAAATSVRPPR